MSPLVRISEPDELTLRVSLESLIDGALALGDALAEAIDDGDTILGRALAEQYAVTRRQIRRVRALLKVEFA